MSFEMGKSDLEPLLPMAYSFSIHAHDLLRDRTRAAGLIPLGVRAKGPRAKVGPPRHQHRVSL
jgi:hypothetical protein